MENPFLRTAKELAALNTKALHNQQHNNAISEPYFHAVVRNIEQPFTAEKLMKQLKETSKELTVIKPTRKEEYVSKLLYGKNQQVDRALMYAEDKQAQLTQRKTPAIDYSEHVLLLNDIPLEQRVINFVKSMRSNLGHTIIGGIRYKTTTTSKNSDMLDMLKSMKNDDPSKFDLLLRNTNQNTREYLTQLI